MQKVPYIIVVGDKEIESESVSIRRRGNKESSILKVGEFIISLKEEIASRMLE
jgi:threonyl-tRNA synthetase